MQNRVLPGVVVSVPPAALHRRQTRVVRLFLSAIPLSNSSLHSLPPGYFSFTSKQTESKVERHRPQISPLRPSAKQSRRLVSLRPADAPTRTPTANPRRGI